MKQAYTRVHARDVQKNYHHLLCGAEANGQDIFCGGGIVPSGWFG
jgi:hypothetical protein